MTVSTPNWSAWTARDTAAAWECVALSVAIEPRCLGLGHFLVLQSESDSPWLSEADPEWLVEMKQRLNLLRDELKRPKSPLRTSESERILAQTPLKLDDFVRWARRKKWRLPEELKTAAKPVSQPAPKPAGGKAVKKEASADPEPKPARRKAAKKAVSAGPEPKPARRKAAKKAVSAGPEPKPAKGRATKKKASAGPEPKLSRGKATKKKASAGPEPKLSRGRATKKKASAGPEPKPARGKAAKNKAPAGADASLGAESRVAHEKLIVALLHAQDLAPEDAAATARVQALIEEAGRSLSDSVIRKRLREIGGQDADAALNPRAAPGYQAIIVGLLHGLGLKPRSRDLLRKLKQRVPQDCPLPPDDIVKALCRSGP